jgi:hypothetical protein
LPEASVIEQLKLVQERRDLEAELAAMGSGTNSVDLDSLQSQFVKVAKSYGSRKGISYASWREVGVPADVLGKAGVTRSG